LLGKKVVQLLSNFSEDVCCHEISQQQEKVFFFLKIKPIMLLKYKEWLDDVEPSFEYFTLKLKKICPHSSLGNSTERGREVPPRFFMFSIQSDH
jgi:hypothetical protein